MKKILFLLIFVFLTSVLGGCEAVEKPPFMAMDKADEETLSFKIEKIILSKGFQTTDPSVEVLKKGSTLKILASLGIVEGSGINIDKITKSGNNINIYIDRLLDDSKVQLSVPQILIEIPELHLEKAEELNFNIINQNYEPIHLKFNKKEILNSIYSQFKISPNTTPNVILSKSHDNMFWNVSFQNIFDKENYKSPLINFNVKVNAHTGEILDSKKDNISNFIDEGQLLDYIPNNFILYKKQNTQKDHVYESLWIYNLETKEKTKIYTSKNKIQSALFNPEGTFISVLETNDNISDLYIIGKTDKIAYKITPADYINPNLIKWKDENNLYFVSVGENRSTLLSYDIVNNDYSPIRSVDFRVAEFDIAKDNFVFVQEEKDLNNKKIFVDTSKMGLKEIGMGYKAKFISSNELIYLKHEEKDDKNILEIYNIEDNEHKDLDYNVSNYFILNENTLNIVEKNTCNNDFTLYRYNLEEKYELPIANINSDKIYYDQSNNKGYISLSPPSENNGGSIIYSVDLGKLPIND